MSRLISQEKLEEIASKFDWKAFDENVEDADDLSDDNSYIKDKSTFVLQKHDLEYLNREFQLKKRNWRDSTPAIQNEQPLKKSIFDDDSDSEEDPDYTDNYKHTNYSSTDEDDLSDEDDIYDLTREIQELESENELENDTDNEYIVDTTDSIYEPPTIMKSKIIIYCIKSIPALIVFASILLVTKMVSMGSYTDNSIDVGLIHHKFHAYEKKLTELSSKQISLQLSYNDIETKSNKVNNELQTKIDSLRLLTSNMINNFEKNVLEVSSIRSGYDSINKQILTIHEELTGLQDGGVETTGDSPVTIARLKALETDHKDLMTKVEDLQKYKFKLEAQFKDLDSRVYQSISQHLPSFVPVIYKQESGFETIPEFDNYMKQLIVRQLNDFDAHGLQPSWDEFVEVNDLKLEKYIIDTAVKNNFRIVSQSDLKESIDSMKSTLKHQLETMKHDLESKQSVVDPAAITRLVKSAISNELNSRYEFQNSNIVNYASYDNGARVIENLTTLPRLKRIRTQVLDRVMHGIFDFIKRNTVGPKRTLIGLNEIDLVKRENSPSNALVANNQFWQALTEDLPVTFAVKLSQNIFIKQVGISYPKINYLLSAAPRKINLLVEPANTRHFKILKNKMSNYYNQDFVNKHLDKYSKISEFEYSIKVSESFQDFPILEDVQQILNEFPIKSVVLLIESNWGNDQVVVLYGIKVFGLTEFEMKNSRVMLTEKFDPKPKHDHKIKISDLGNDIPF
ncbi:hypothetical protein CANARDRAFT_27296 [[Candida] arabinofermentans NRRL YB-2248]|uniref:SUN domain-containing protein n=1 Tax=[Candida] arabinofermentans NRRL YB-2248 TaxID=983967 RepID=A0A1E4T5C3_9ASCO|nr:hypothetical protein CANARDRAFT_27296 [[Candida] arabinofermentans NRRL YB-2248]